MGSQLSSKPLQSQNQHHLNGLSRLTLPQHTNPSGITSNKHHFQPDFSFPDNFQQSQANILTVTNQQLEQQQQKQLSFQSPYSLLRTTYNPKLAPDNSHQEVRGTNKSDDSLRETHLNQNTKKSTLKQKINSDLSQVSQSMFYKVSKPLESQKPKSLSVLNAHINVVSSDGSVNQKPPLSERNQFNQPYNLLKIPANIDEVKTIKLSQKSQTRQLHNSENQYHYLNNTQNTINQILQKDYEERGYFILTDTHIGEKRMTETTTNPQSSENSLPYRKSISEWIAEKLCGVDDEALNGDKNGLKKSWDCNLFAQLKKPNMLAREPYDNYELPNEYQKKTRN